MNNTPNHVALILDGNGRYALKLNKNRSYGHKKGLQNILNIVNSAIDLKIKYITFFCFSSQNWKRNKSEISNIFDYAVDELNNIINNDVNNRIIIKFIGDLMFSNVPKYFQKKINFLKEFINDINNKSANYNTGNIIVTIALNYGGREEILSAVNKAIIDYQEPISENSFEKLLWSNFLPDVDILIRTSGEYRISNFLLWKIAYSELFFIKKLWPEFTKNDFENVINDFISNRKRRFGGY